MNPAYRIVRSRRASVSIEVDMDGSVLVRAPERATDEHIERVVLRKRAWVKAKTGGSVDRRSEVPTPLVGGSSVLYLGRHYRLRVVSEAGQPFSFDGRFLIREDALPEAETHLRAWFEAEATRVILPLVEDTAARMGFQYRAARLADLKARWGSFSPGAVLTFNWRLVHAPMFVIRYVVAHELAHTLHPHHGPDFWNLVRAICTRADEARTWLAAHESDLERLGAAATADTNKPSELLP